MKPAPKLLLAAALLLVALGVGLAVLQPGGLGDDDAGTQTAQPAVTETETESDTETDTETETATDGEGTDGQVDAGGIGNDGGDTTTTTTTAATPTTAGGSAAPTTTAAAPSTTAAPTTSTTRPVGSVGGSGLDGVDDEVAAADTEDGLANTGGTSAIGTVLVLGLAGLLLRRRTA